MTTSRPSATPPATSKARRTRGAKPLIRLAGRRFCVAIASGSYMGTRLGREAPAHHASLSAARLVALPRSRGISRLAGMSSSEDESLAQHLDRIETYMAGCRLLPFPRERSPIRRELAEFLRAQ